MVRQSITLPVGLLSLIAPTIAQLPYNPARIVSSNDTSIAYIFSPDSSSQQASFSILNASNTVNSTGSTRLISNTLPFLSSSSSKAFIPVSGDGGLKVLAGDCSKTSNGLELWSFQPSKDLSDGTWSSSQLDVNDQTLGAEYLSAGFTFSPTHSAQDASVYVFGGMCPKDSSNSENGASDATYSNTMLTLSPNLASKSSTPYQLSVTGARAPPIAEAGLTITPLNPTFSNNSGAISQQQNFLLLGGHTQNAFINMSQVALFSLPESAWAFLGVDQPSGSDNTELRPRDQNIVEPRSGHTAVITEDGSKIIVLGGWVGDTNTPAQPQLAVLEIGQGYGGPGRWSWSIPSQTGGPLATNHGLYGHAAAIFPGGVMIVTGGHSITGSGSKVKRQSQNNLQFFNTTSMTWINSYINPSSPNSPNYIPAPSTQGLSSSQKAGIGVGIAFGLIAIAIAAGLFYGHHKKRRAQRIIREKELRAMALGTERYQSPSLYEGLDEPRFYARSASWGNLQEKQIESPGNSFLWTPPTMNDGNGTRQAERTGAMMDVPSPTRGLRKSLHARGPGNYGGFQPMPLTGPGSVFPIVEEDERSQTGSAKTPRLGVDRSPVASDPFKDPPTLEPSRQDHGAIERKREVQEWVHDWASAAESMNISRNPSQAESRTYSNLSQAQSYSQSSSDRSDRISPDKSDRTGSNLSERSLTSNYSIQRSVTGTVSRTVSQRSNSAGYALFAGAAAAMGRYATGRSTEQEEAGGLARAPSNRSVSMYDQPISSRAETFSTVRSSTGSAIPVEDQALLGRLQSKKRRTDSYWTPPESPVKDKYPRTSSLTSVTQRKAMGILGSVKRAFTGRTEVDDAPENDHISNPSYDSSSRQSSPTKYLDNLPEIREPEPQGPLHADLWRGKRGAKDWNDGKSLTVPTAVNSLGSTVRRKPVAGQTISQVTEGSDDEDWDVETAVQQRVVQVMFTVPKQKLRVVNADALSLLSSNRSEADLEDDRERDISRMNSIRQVENDEYGENGIGSRTKGKGVDRRS